MAHMVKYWKNGQINFVPTVTRSVKAKAHTSPADVMLVSALLHMYYSATGQQPPGAPHVIKPSGTFTAQTRLFITDYQQRYSRLRQDGSVSVLPIGHTDDQLFNYTMFHLFSMVVTLSKDGDEDTVVQALKTYPHLHDLDAAVLALPQVSPESGGGALGIVTGPT